MPDLKTRKKLSNQVFRSEEQICLDKLQPETKFFQMEYSDNDLHFFGLSRVVLEAETEYQRVLIVDSFKFGRLLFLDGELQSAEADEELYHELLVQPAMLSHPNPRRVLIIGGGEGAALREVLRHKSLELVDMVDIDGQLIELAKTYLDSFHRGSFADPRLRLHFNDGRLFLEKNSQKYDLVILDLLDYEESGRAEMLYSREFFQLLKSNLAAGAIVTVQAMEFSLLQMEKHALLLRTLKSVFGEVHGYHAYIPSFLCDWSFMLASDWFNPTRLSVRAFDDAAQFRTGNGALKHLDGEFFLSCLHFPKSCRKKFSETGPVIVDQL